jgi:hypothetical protein
MNHQNNRELCEWQKDGLEAYSQRTTLVPSEGNMLFASIHCFHCPNPLLMGEEYRTIRPVFCPRTCFEFGDCFTPTDTEAY